MVERFENLLDEISDCFVSDDFGRWIDLISIPFTIVRNPGHVVLKDVNALMRYYESIRGVVTGHGIDAIVRLPISFDGFDDGTYHGTFATELISGGYRLVEPYETTALLHETSNKLKMNSILHTGFNSTWTELPHLSYGTIARPSAPALRTAQAA